jgi:bifunctional non-homologous end joining protein LigD
MTPRKSKSSPATGGTLRAYKQKRDFSRSPEPSGDEATRASPRAKASRDGGSLLQFVIQKHAASHLHFDFRLELDGVMKSWAVPKGPSLDPGQRRLAMEVEDHPIAYNTFEGTIPKGEYGGGTVMLWDRGTYTADDAEGDPVAALRAGYRKGDLKIWLDGERLRGAWVLRRIKPAPNGGSGERAQWLLIKRHDEFTQPGSDVVATYDTSVTTGRTMEEIASGKSKVWRSNRPARREARGPSPEPRAPRPESSAPSLESLEPMLATLSDTVPKGDGWTFEPKYDGIRVLAYITPRGARDAAVTLVTRNLKDKSKQFPEVVDALRKLATQVGHPLVIDGEIVAVDAEGRPSRFQALQSRMHVTGTDDIAGHATDTPSALYAFDILLDGDDVLLKEPWSARRARLEKVLRNRTTPRLRLAESVPNDGEQTVEHAREQGWEGVIAKRMSSRYEPGARSRAWLKLKVEWRQEFVVGGWTEPRLSRKHLGALLLGYYDDDGDRLVYVGHTGGGMDAAALRDMAARLAPLERKTSPFAGPVKTNERPHWVDPRVVVEVKFSQWTADGKLRHPIFLGVRDDKDPRAVRLESRSVQRTVTDSAGAREVGGRTADQSRREVSRQPSGRRPRKRSAHPLRAYPRSPQSLSGVVKQLEQIEGDGVLAIDRTPLEVSNLNKVFFPEDGYTKGDLMRYYAAMARYVLPVVADRPLVLKRYPNGIYSKAFFQQRAPDDVPEGVRVEVVRNDQGEEQERIIGGDLLTLLWTVQLGAISVDPWLSRVQTCDDADMAIIDLDPGPEATFRRAVDVARWTKDELDALGLRAALKTSGATGLHVALPLPPHTSYETAQTLAQLVASRVAERHPEVATLERSVKSRPADSVYVDYLQNIRGKTVAGAYAVRARRGAPVSTPLDWAELTDDLDPGAFTIESVPARVAKVGDLWAKATKKANTLAALKRIAEGKSARGRRRA